MEEKSLLISLPLQIAELRTSLIFAAVSILSFFIPFGLGHPQWFVGVIVNAFLFLSAIFLPKKYFLPVVILPNLGVLARGLIFGSLTPFLIYFVPFIWIGNLVLILAFNYLFPKFRFIGSTIAASIVKFAVLFAVANLYFNFHLVPKLFLQSMGVFQLLTALAGGLISFIIFNYVRNRGTN